MPEVTWISPDQARDAIECGTGRNIRIAVLDSGVETDHSALHDLKLRDDLVIRSRGGRVDAVEANGQDVFGHGTAVTDIIHRQVPQAEIGSFRVLGHFKESRATIIREGIREAALRGYDIIHCSFGAPARAQDAAIYKGWLDALYLRGIHVIAAGSNADFQTAEWPAHFPTVVAVGSDPEDRSTLQRIGNSLVEFAICGREQRAAWLNNEYKEVFGSSFAAPRVTAMVARLLSVYPTLHPLHVKSLMLEIADK